MKPQKPVIINLLNEVLKNEMTPINQYYLHAKILKDLGYELLAPKERAQSVEEVEHAGYGETQLGLIDGMGLKNFLQHQMKPA